MGCCCVTEGAYPVPCDSAEGGDAGQGRRKAHEGGDICILMANSCCSMAEANTTL